LLQVEDSGAEFVQEGDDPVRLRAADVEVFGAELPPIGADFFVGFLVSCLLDEHGLRGRAAAGDVAERANLT